MLKMKTPEVDVIRFTESDIVAASGGRFLTVAGLGNTIPDATFTIGSSNVWSSEQVNNNNSGFTTAVNNYLGSNDFDGKLYAGSNSYSVSDLAYNDFMGMDGMWDDTEAQYNGTFEWNGSRFVKQ